MADPPRTADPPPPRRLVVWPLLLSVVLLFAGSLAAFAAALLLAGREADELADARTALQLTAALTQEKRRLETQSLDWAWWDEAIERFVLSPDPAYAQENLGAYADNVLGISAALVIAPDDQIAFAFLEGAAMGQESAALWDESITPLVAATRAASSAEEPRPASNFLAVGAEGLFLVTATAMASEAGEPVPGWDRPAVLLFARRINAAFLEPMAAVLGLEALSLESAEQAGDNVLDLVAADDRVVARLTWQLHYPADQIIAALLPTAAVIALAMLLLVGLLLVRILVLTEGFRRERERREAELIAAERRASRADRAKSLFLANTSHELRTPLNAVIGFAETLRLEIFGSLNDRQRSYLGHIEEGGRHLLSVLQDILDMARIEARREQLEERTVVPRQLVERACRLVEPLRGERGIALAVEEDQEVEGLVLRADERRLLQMLLNLLSNALSFSPQGSAVRIRISGWRPEAPERGAAMVSPAEVAGLAIAVCDQGPGLLGSEIDHVLQPFHRPLSGLADGKRESNGLGLPLTAMLMSLHGGELLLANAREGGLVASLRFPASRTAPSAERPLPAESLA